MASRRGWPFLFLLHCLEQDPDGQRNEARCAAARVDAVVARLDESLEARAQRNLDAATDVPSEVVVRGFRAQRYRHRLRPVADCDCDVVAGVGSSAEITCRECNSY